MWQGAHMLEKIYFSKSPGIFLSLGVLRSRISSPGLLAQLWVLFKGRRPSAILVRGGSLTRAIASFMGHASLNM